MAHVFAERALDFYDLNLNDLIADIEQALGKAVSG